MVKNEKHKKALFGEEISNYAKYKFKNNEDNKKIIK